MSNGEYTDVRTWEVMFFKCRIEVLGIMPNIYVQVGRLIG